MLQITDKQFYTNNKWNRGVNWEWFPRNVVKLLNLFDQNGYRLTELEQDYSFVNNQPCVLHGHERSLRKEWMTYPIEHTGPHLNHAFLFERKGYEGEALDQLKKQVVSNPLLYKLINYKGKWGVDFSMDYVDDKGTSMEIIHFEYDSYDFKEIVEIKGMIESKVKLVDWNFAANQIIKRKDEWINLEFFEQSKYKTDFFGLPAERFKTLAWE